MKRLVLCLAVLSIFVSTVLAQDISAKKGREIFEAKGCAVCHKDNIDAIGPSLARIAKTYLGREIELLSYLRGQSPAIVDPSRASVMNPQLIKIRMLFDPEMQALSIYIVSANDRLQ